MRPYFWRIVICVTPVLLSVWAIWVAYAYDTFKLGVDLSGGTILVYEVDTRKQLSDGRETFDPKKDTNLLAESLKRRIDPNDLYNVTIRPAGGEGRVEIILPTGSPQRAEKAQADWETLLREMETDYGLKKNSLDVQRGRPQELANRIQQRVAEQIWAEKLFKTPKSLQELAVKATDFKPLSDELYRDADLSAALAFLGTADNIFAFQSGAVALELANRLQQEAQTLKPQKIKDGKEKDVEDPVKKRLGTIAFFHATKTYSPFKSALAYYIYKKPLAARFLPATSALDRKGTALTAAAIVGGANPGLNPLVFQLPTAAYGKAEANSLQALVDVVKKRVNDFSKEKEINYWFKQQAWTLLIERLQQKWPALKERADAFKNIEPDSFDELIGRAELRGNTIGQAFLTTLEPVMGNQFVTGGETGDKEFIPRGEVAQFITENYGPSIQSIEKKIEKSNEASGRQKDLTVEEVQRIKDLVSKVGSLEFRILANENDDREAIKEAKDLFELAKLNNPALKTELEQYQLKGQPPPGPRTGGATGAPKEYGIKLARGEISKVSYSWVELGPQERQQLHLNNLARSEPGHGSNWADMAAARSGGYATQLKLPGGGGDRHWLNGALFFSRNCEDRNLPEEDRRKKQYEYFVLTRNPEVDPLTGKEKKIDGSYLVSAVNQQGGDGRPAVSFTFNSAGGALFGDLTARNVPSAGTTGEDASNKRHLAIILDGLVMSAPTINSQITTHGQISGSFTSREVDALVNILRAGALPATLKPQPVSESTMGATLGQDTIRSGVWAIGLAFAAVLAFMIIYYRFAGLVACVALLANLLITVGFMVAVKATFTLPGMAGLVLTLGMAVDANILIYERLREERERGANLLVAIRQGYDRAFGTIIDTHLSSIFTAVVLYIVGNDQLKGFGISMTLGLLISLFTSLYMTRLMFDLWQARGWLKNLSMMRLFGRPDFDFMGIRYYWFTATLILTVLGMVIFIGRLPNDLNIDFRGGTAYGGQLREGKAKNTEEYRAMFDEHRQKERLKGKVEVQEIEGSEGRRFSLKYKNEDGSLTKERTINITTDTPEGNTKEARAKAIEARAEELPDWSVELIFPSKHQEADTSKSRFFNVRTAEKESELVQATLDRLLQEKDPKTGKWEELLKKVQMSYDPVMLAVPRTNRETRVKFTEGDAAKDAHYASPSFVKTLLTRELLREFKVKDVRQLPFTLDMIGEGKNEDGRYAVAKLTFNPLETKKIDAAASDKIKSALDRTVQEFMDRPQPERLETFDSQLAQETRMRAMYAVLLSWGAILLYLWFRFGNWTFGAAAVLCLVHDLFFTLGIIACCHYVHNWWPGFLGIEDFKIDLTAVAALLTLVGYSVNDTIVVFDRIREVRGKNPDLTPQMINDSVNQTLSRTILASLSVWLVVFVLYAWGGPGVHLFAFVMVVGVIVGTYSSIYIASPLLLLFGEGSRAAARGREQQPTGVKPEVGIQPAP